MEEKRRCDRFPVQGRARYYKYNPPDLNGLFITNFSKEGIGIGLPYRYDMRNGDELDLQIELPPLTKPVTVTGTVMWTKALDCYHDYALIGGIKFKKIDSEQKWALIDHVYDTLSKKFDKGAAT